MNLELVVKRFLNQWQQFALIGVGGFLVQAVYGFVALFLGILVAGPTVLIAFSSASMRAMNGFPSEGGILGMLAAFGLLFILLLVGGVVTSGLIGAGMVGSVAAHRRGEEVSLGSFWAHAKAHWSKVALLSLLVALTMLVSMILLVIPVLGWIAMLIWGPIVFIHLYIYPAYLIVTQSMGVTDAFGVGFRVITTQFAEAVIAGLFSLAISVIVWILAFIPLLGVIAALIFVQPFTLYFFTERFETVVRPKLGF